MDTSPADGRVTEDALGAQQGVLLTGGGRRPAALAPRANSQSQEQQPRREQRSRAGLELRLERTSLFPASSRDSASFRSNAEAAKKKQKTKTIRHYSLKMISWGNPRERFTSLALAARLTDWSSMFVSRSAADVNDRLDVRRNPKSLLGSEGREHVLICVFMSSPYQASNSSSSLFPSRRQLPKPTVGDSKASMCL